MQLTNYFTTGTYDAAATAEDLGLQGNFDEIWYPVIQTTFEEMNTLEGLYRKHNISNGTSLKVPVMEEGTVAFTKTGGTIPQEDIEHGAVIISVTDALTGSVTIYDDDKAAISYSFIETKVKNVAKAMAKLHAREIVANMVLAARGTRNAGDVNVVAGNTPNAPISLSGYNAMTDEEKGIALAGALFKAQEKLDLADVKEERFFVCSPSVYYKLSQNLTAINQFYGGSGAYKDGNIEYVAGIKIVKTNAYGQAPVDGKGDFYTSVDYGTAGTDLSLGVVATDEAVINVDLLSMNTEHDRIPAKRCDVWYLSKVNGYGIGRNDVAVEIKEAV